MATFAHFSGGCLAAAMPRRCRLVQQFASSPRFLATSGVLPSASSRGDGRMLGGVLSTSRRSFFWGGAAAPIGDISNCGCGFGDPIPRPELVTKEGMEKGSPAWTAQLYGAAVYWHLAGLDSFGETDPDSLRGRDVLEVGCALGGGSRYLAEITEPQNYIATDIDPKLVEKCLESHSPWPGLSFRPADARNLHVTFGESVFDVIISAQCPSYLEDDEFMYFLGSAFHVLRPGGHVAACEMFDEAKAAVFVDIAKQVGFEVTKYTDLTGRSKHVGICKFVKKEKYYSMVFRKPAADDSDRPRTKAPEPYVHPYPAAVERD